MMMEFSELVLLLQILSLAEDFSLQQIDEVDCL